MPAHLTSRRPALRAAATATLTVALLAASAGFGRAGESRGTDEVSEAALVRTALDRWQRGRSGGGRVQVLDPFLAERIHHLRATAPTFDLAWRDLERSGAPVVIGTREQLNVHLPRFVRGSTSWAGITVSWDDPGGSLTRSAVALRVDWLRELHASYGNSHETFVQALDALLVHEVYGHLVPVVERGTARYSCADPGPRDRLADSCVGRRELMIRAERDSVLTAYRLASAGRSPSSGR